MNATGVGPERIAEIATRVEGFVRDVVTPRPRDPRRDHDDCPTQALVAELKDQARAAGVLTPHILPGPTEVHKWSLAKKIERDWTEARA